MVTLCLSELNTLGVRSEWWTGWLGRGRIIRPGCCWGGLLAAQGRIVAGEMGTVHGTCLECCWVE